MAAIVLAILGLDPMSTIGCCDTEATANEKNTIESGGVVVTTPAFDAGRTGSIPGTGSCDIKIWFSTLGTVYPS